MLILLLALYKFEPYLELHQKHIAEEDKNLDGLVINQGQLVLYFFWGRGPTERATILWKLQQKRADTHYFLCWMRNVHFIDT